MEQMKSDQMEKCKTKKRRSLFSVIENVQSPSTAKYDKETQFREILIAEKRAWKTVLKEKERELLKLRTQDVNLNEEILTEEQKYYINDFVDIQKFGEEGMEFSKEVIAYKKEHSQVINRINKLNDAYQDVIKELNLDIIEEAFFM